MQGRFLSIIALATAGSCFTAAQAAPLQRVRPHRQMAQPVVQPAAAPAVPLSPEQMPSTPPQVAFNSGILTIIANNSTLGDILRAVHRQTGASVDVPGNATERVVGQFGPGPARDVLSTLLNGSHFNYVLLGSQTNANALDRVMLISKTSGGPEQPVQQANAAPIQSQVPAPQVVDNAEQQTDDNAEMTPDSPETLDDQSNNGQTADDQQQQPQQGNPFGQPGAAVKTPEQLLQELQQRQQQMQQQQQPGFQPTPLSPAPPPH